MTAGAMRGGQDGGRMTVRKMDKKEEGDTLVLQSRSHAVTHLRLHLVTFCHLMPSPCHPHVRATLSPIPLTTEPVSLLSCDQVHP